MGYIYRIRHIETGMSYIGQTVNLQKRIRNHFNGNCPDCRYIHNAIQKHGKDAFTWEIICEVSDELLTALEICYIQVLRTLNPNGYNLREGGANGKPSAETRKRQSEAQKRREPDSPETRRRKSAGQKRRAPYSPETMKRKSEAQKGKKHTPESKRQMSQSRMGNRNRIGAKHSPETRRRIGQASKGRRHSPETRQRIAKSVSLARRKKSD